MSDLGMPRCILVEPIPGVQKKQRVDGPFPICAAPKLRAVLLLIKLKIIEA